MTWQWKQIEFSWVCGEPNLGCGVFETQNGWEANVVIFNEIYGMPPRATKEEAMCEAENSFDKLYQSYHELVN